MSLPVFRSTQVRHDIVEIYRYIHDRSPQSAEAVLAAIERNIKALGVTPGLGRTWPSPDPKLLGMRMAVVTPYRNYVIFYRYTRVGVEIYRVVHGARQLQQIVDDIEIGLEN